MKKSTGKTPADYAARNHAVKILVGQAGVKMRDPLDRLDWALDFSQRPTAEIFALADGPLDMVRGEILAFLGHHGPAWMSDASILELTPAAIADLRSDTAQGIKGYLSPDGWTLPPAMLHIVRAADGSTHVVRGLKNLKLAFLSTVADLLIPDGRRVSHCPRPGCGRLFAVRKRGMFCSTKCAGLVRAQRFNAKQEK
jgi:hypothetical protein